jgi:NADH dehydrogenase FAD-containing subunit
VGDGAHWSPGGALPKAGVFAVRQGPVLQANLRAALTGAALQAYKPQRHFLALLATADARAIAARGPFGASGRWAWHWKDRIDRAFIGRFAHRAP